MIKTSIVNIDLLNPTKAIAKNENLPCVIWVKAA
jgi:hypothetical protein